VLGIMTLDFWLFRGRFPRGVVLNVHAGGRDHALHWGRKEEVGEGEGGRRAWFRFFCGCRFDGGSRRGVGVGQKI